MDVAKDFMQQDDIEFGHIDPTSYDPKELELLNLDDYFEHGF
jgi:hypothetical protein